SPSFPDLTRRNKSVTTRPTLNVGMHLFLLILYLHNNHIPIGGAIIEGYTVFLDFFNLNFRLHKKNCSLTVQPKDRNGRTDGWKDFDSLDEAKKYMDSLARFCQRANF